MEDRQVASWPGRTIPYKCSNEKQRHYNHSEPVAGMMWPWKLASAEAQLFVICCTSGRSSGDEVIIEMARPENPIGEGVLPPENL